jgi:hypothetical protein
MTEMVAWCGLDKQYDAGRTHSMVSFSCARQFASLPDILLTFSFSVSRTDSHNDPIPSKASFDLPEPTTTTSNDGDDQIITVKEWKWADPDWWVDMKLNKEGLVDEDGWQYTNNAWKNPSGKGGLRQFTRRRKWCRNAKLVETVNLKRASVGGTGTDSKERTDRKRSTIKSADDSS